MGNAVAANFRPLAQFSGITGANSALDAKQIWWKMSRVLKAAGWIYKCSGNASTGAVAKDTTGAYASDLWNGYGLPITGQSGNTATISSVASNIATITGLSGMTANSVGRVLQLKGCSTAANNGYWRINSFISATSVTVFAFNSSSTEGSNGSIYWQELDSTYVNGSGSTASISNFTGHRVVTVTGLSNMTPQSTNRWLNISGASNGGNNGTFKILSYLSSSSVTIINTAGVAPDGNNGNISWKELDPLQEQYVPLLNNASVTGPWICMQGPSTLRMRFTTQSTGTFIRGETVQQSNTGAQAEVLGYQFDSVASDGYLILMPQINGSGGGVQGWDGSSAITGLVSGATLTPSNTPQEFVRELVIWLIGTSPWNFQSFMQCVDSVGENTSRFSTTLAASAGCTSSIAPGGGGTGNVFPTVGSYVFCGAPGAAGQFGQASSGALNAYNNAQMMCADATYDGYRSADGSWTCAVGFMPFNAPASPATGAHIGYVYTRVDNQEDGDVDPYVMYCPIATVLYTVTTTSFNTPYSTIEEFTAANTPQLSSSSNSWGSGNHVFSGWRRRGMLTNDTFQGFTGSSVCVLFNSSGTVNAAATSAQNPNPSDGQKTATRGNLELTEPIWIVSAQNTQKMRKGTARWIRLVDEGSALQLYGSGTWIQLSNSPPAFIVGPWDGISTPEH